MSIPATSPRSLSVCIVSHNAYDTMSGKKAGFVGGVEWQTSLLARWLVDRGHRVTMITWSDGGPNQEETIAGVRIIKICRKSDGLPGVRFLHPKWTTLNAALRKADADVYYHNCGECVTGQVAMWCKRNNRPFVFTAANDTDCDAKLPTFHYWKDRVLYRYGLRNLSAIVVQTRKQQQMLRDGYQLEAEVIPMPCVGPKPGLSQARPRPASSRVLWVARLCKQKRPDRLMEVAEKMPETTFDVVGPHYDEPIVRGALEHAAKLPNVVIHGSQPRPKVAEKYLDAALLLCTSDYEGFPNTFLEAWSHGLPIVSTFDPDGLIQSQKLGVVGKSVDDLVMGIRGLLTDNSYYAQISGNALRFFRETHSSDIILPRFEEVFLRVARPTATSQGSRAGAELSYATSDRRE